MTRKDYEHLAEVLGVSLAETQDPTGGGTHPVAQKIVWAVADGLRGTNPRYDRARFMEAVYEHANTRRRQARCEDCGDLWEGDGESYRFRRCPDCRG